MSLKITSISIVIVFKTISILVQAQSDLALRAFDSASHTTFPTSWATTINLRPVCHFVKADICYWWWNSWISSNWWGWWNTPPWATNGLLRIFTSQSESRGNWVVNFLKLICIFFVTLLCSQCLWYKSQALTLAMSTQWKMSLRYHLFLVMMVVL